MMTSPFPSTSTTGPCGDFIRSSRFSVPALRISSSSVLSVFRSDMSLCSLCPLWLKLFTTENTEDTESFVVVFEVAPDTTLRVDVEDNARVDRTRVHVQADGALVPIGQILDPMNRLLFVDGIEWASGHAQL